LKEKNVRTSSEKPTADDVGTAYDLGAEQANNEPLEKDTNWSSGDTNLQSQKEEAHEIALNNEEEHYQTNHPHKEGEIEVFETVDVEQPAQNRRSYRDVQIEASMILAERRKEKK